MSAPAYGPLVEVPYLGTTVRAFAGRPATLDAALRRAAAQWGDRPAVVVHGTQLTYAELDAAVDSAAGALLGAGVTAGDRVAVAAEHGLQLWALPFVCSRAGVTGLLLNTALAPERWAAQLDRARPSLIAAESRLRPRLKQAAALAELDGLGPVAGVDEVMPLRSSSPADRVDSPDEEDRPVALIATSGTTGVPKMATVSSRGLIHAALAYGELLSLGPQERSLVVLPLTSIGPLSAQTTAMPLFGGCCVLPDDTAPAAGIANLARHAITHLDAVPAWLGLMLREEPTPLPDWRVLIYGGAPMPPESSSELSRRWPGLQHYDVWGLTETHGPATAVRAVAGQARPAGTVGRPIAGVEVRALDGDGGIAAPNRPGQLQVRGANVTPGYYDDPDLTAAVIEDGWLSTGDVGAQDDDANVRILDRMKDVILRGGTNVFSVEVEQVLCSAPGIVEAGVYGVADALGGESIAAAVVVAPGVELDEQALRRLVGDRIGVHAVPRRISPVGSLPRNAMGKIDKRQLRTSTQ